MEEQPQPTALSQGPVGPRPPRARQIILARLFLGLVVLTTTEVFSGASVAPGLWQPWTWLVTYWLYFAHFFFFATLAVWSGRTSLRALFLWGILFGLYESWITKVIWSGYEGTGHCVLGKLGPFGFSELSMVVLFHPVLAWLVPLAVACVLCPPLRAWFPDLAWFSGPTRSARWVRIYLVLSCATTLGMNSLGPVNLLLNLALILTLLALFSRLSRTAIAACSGASWVLFGRKGFVALCLYLALLYGVTYFGLRRNGLPSAAVQLLTLGFYALVIMRLIACPKDEPQAEAPRVDPAELRRLLIAFFALLGISLILSLAAVRQLVYAAVFVNFILWTPLGFALTLLAFWPARRSPKPGPS